MIIRRMDDLGRIVIPKELRKEIGLNTYKDFEGKEFEIKLNDNKNGFEIIMIESEE